MKRLKNHEEALKEKVFFSKKKWPHFELLLNDIKTLAKKYTSKNILFLERTNLYGGISLFSPFFYKNNNCISIDCITTKILKRGAYNSKLLRDNKIIKTKSKYQKYYKNINFKKKFDLVLIPNLMHHVEDPETILKKSFNLLNKKGSIYIFEPLIRELHQLPEDYGRFTPSRLKTTLSDIGFSNFKIRKTGGPFTCISYFWDQAIQYIPKNKRINYSRWLDKEFEKFNLMDKKYKKNLVRKNTEAPVAFSIIAYK